MASGAVCGRVVGRRSIDGSQVIVVRVGSQYYAALPHAVKAR